MRINHVAESEDGEKVTFQGVLEGPELAFVLEYGLNMLLREGALPFVSVEDECHEEYQIMDAPEREQ